MAKVLYKKAGTDPATIVHPDVGPPRDRFTLTDGVAVVCDGLIGYGDGTITYADGRLFPARTAQGSTVAHQRS